MARVTSRLCPRPTMLRGDGRDLLGRLAESEDDFREPLSQVPVSIDPGEAQVLEGRGPHGVEHACGRVGADCAGPTSSRSRLQSGVVIRAIAG